MARDHEAWYCPLTSYGHSNPAGSRAFATVIIPVLFPIPSFCKVVVVVIEGKKRYQNSLQLAQAEHTTYTYQARANMNGEIEYVNVKFNECIVKYSLADPLYCPEKNNRTVFKIKECTLLYDQIVEIYYRKILGAQKVKCLLNQVC